MSELNEKLVERVARVIAAEAMTQNPMLIPLERDEDGVGVIGYFDDYDNKAYDCETMARAAIKAVREVKG